MMATLNQYVDGYSYGSISTDIQQLVGNAVGMLDKYILVRTGEYEYSALIQSPGSDTAKKITISRSGNNSIYNVEEETGKEFSWNISNPYYSYSNLGFGKALQTITAYEQSASIAVSAMVCILVLALFFKGVLFTPWRKKR